MIGRQDIHPEERVDETCSCSFLYVSFTGLFMYPTFASSSLFPDSSLLDTVNLAIYLDKI